MADFLLAIQLSFVYGCGVYDLLFIASLYLYLIILKITQRFWYHCKIVQILLHSI